MQHIPPGQGAQAPVVRRIIHAQWSGYARLWPDGRLEMLAAPEHGRWSPGPAGGVLIHWPDGRAEAFRPLGEELVLASMPDPAGLHLPPYPCPAADLLGAELARTPAAQPWLHPARPGPRLGIVIPYRNRQLHLAKLLPHLISFFQRDLRNSHIQPLIVVSEQADDGKFNRGFCCNLGFAALRDHCDYICFHDVDYLPMWADYSASAFPSRIVWWGHHMRPLKADPANQYWLKGSRTGLGAVSVMDKAQYQAVNGYSNAYRGWGFEDTDLVARFALKGLPVQQRDGTFEPLDHDNAGMLAPGQLSPEWVANEARFKHQSAVYQQTGGMPEGLNSLAWHSLAFMFERWAGLDESEAGIICRIRAQQPG